MNKPDNQFGFECRMPRDEIAAEDGVYRLSVRYGFFSHGDSGERDYFYLTSDYPLPDRNQRHRIGDPSHEAFQVVGSTVYMQMQAALRRCFGKGYDDFPEILDWGCGCGRMLRHFVARSKSRITGIDIDLDNLQWSKEHYPTAVFLQGGLEPPLDIPDNSFDFIYGISVFTHLTEDLQHRWLAELRRITKPDGVIIMTVTGDVAWFHQRYSLAQYQAW